MNFGQAIEALKQGKKVARVGWNGKGMFLILIDSATLLTNKRSYVTKDIVGVCSKTIGSKLLSPFITMKAADDSYVPWLASQTDMLAEDWQVL